MGPLDMMNLMKNAKKIQENMQEEQAKFAERIFIGEAGAGAVRVEIDGKYRARELMIEPEYAKESLEVLQDLIVAAINNATSQIAKAQEENASKLLGNSGLGGLGGLSDFLK